MYKIFNKQILNWERTALLRKEPQGTKHNNNHSNNITQLETLRLFIVTIMHYYYYYLFCRLGFHIYIQYICQLINSDP